ncbi:MAG: hypothetical protein KAT00_04725 [Planctomycetes bacterium]|nr:hypothetical protein [Planctomycetota bacterium]
MNNDIGRYPDISMMPLAVGLKHFERVYEWTSAILNAINRCGLDGQYWISTKGSGTVIVIHCEDHFFEGNCRSFASVVKDVNEASMFVYMIERSGMLKRGEYPWIIKEDGEGGDGHNEDTDR